MIKFQKKNNWNDHFRFAFCEKTAPCTVIPKMEKSHWRENKPYLETKGFGKGDLRTPIQSLWSMRTNSKRKIKKHLSVRERETWTNYHLILFKFKMESNLVTIEV